MRRGRIPYIAAMVFLVFATSAAAASMTDMRWRRRVVLVASARLDDPRAVQQRRILGDWSREAAARDVSLVQVSSSNVVGVSDTAAALRSRYHLQPGSFQVILLGKDGHVALRSERPVSAETLQAAIDAMPMRRAGSR